MSTISANGATQSVLLRQSGADVEYSTDSTSWATVSWPATVVNTNPGAGNTLQILFTTDLTLNTNNSFFICGSTYLQFGSRTLKADGSRPIINIGAGATSYPGLIRNGTSSAVGVNNIYVINLTVHSDGAVLADDGGWVCQGYFATPNSQTSRIINCSSDGTITNGSGGIVGANQSAISGGGPYIIGCSSSGAISGLGAGGIVGRLSTRSITIEYSFSTGDISSGGGIIGNNASSAAGNGLVTNCYSTGAILGGSGGIVGKDSSILVLHSYSTGAIDTNSGGIYGENAVQAIAFNCYSLGTIAAGGGGIIGANSGNAMAYYCYTAGECIGGLGGIIAGVAASNPTANTIGNFSQCADGGGGGWNATNAANTLQNIGSTWIAVAAGSPYLLLGMGYSPYSLTNILPDYGLNRSAQRTVSAGTEAAAAILPAGYTYSIVAINSGNPNVYPTIGINSSTGAITTTRSTTVATYTILVYNVNNPYSFSQFTLTVSEPLAYNVLSNIAQGLYQGLGVDMGLTSVLWAYPDPIGNSISSVGQFTAATISSINISTISTFNTNIQLSASSGEFRNSSISTFSANGATTNFPQLLTSSISTISITGTTNLRQITEIIDIELNATGNWPHNFNSGGIFFHSNIASNFTTALFNVPTTQTREIVTTLILAQGATPYYSSTLTINGTTTAIQWMDGSIPVPIANRIECETFNIFNINNTWSALGRYFSFGTA